MVDQRLIRWYVVALSIATLQRGSSEDSCRDLGVPCAAWEERRSA